MSNPCFDGRGWSDFDFIVTFSAPDLDGAARRAEDMLRALHAVEGDCYVVVAHVGDVGDDQVRVAECPTCLQEDHPHNTTQGEQG